MYNPNFYVWISRRKTVGNFTASQNAGLLRLKRCRLIASQNADLLCFKNADLLRACAPVRVVAFRVRVQMAERIHKVRFLKCEVKMGGVTSCETCIRHLTLFIRIHWLESLFSVSEPHEVFSALRALPFFPSLVILFSCPSLLLSFYSLVVPFSPLLQHKLRTSHLSFY